MRRKIIILFITAFVSIFGAAACGAVEDEVRNRAQDEVDKQKQRVADEVEKGRQQVEDKVKEATKLVEDKQ